MKRIGSLQGFELAAGPLQGFQLAAGYHILVYILTFVVMRNDESHCCTQGKLI